MTRRLVRKTAAKAAGAFDYSRVPDEHREALRDDAGRIRDALISAAASLMDAGERLARWRTLLPHGTWLEWAAAETGMSEQWARDSIAVFKKFEHQPLLLQDLHIAMPPTALIDLARAPSGAFEDVVDRATEGERLRVADVKEIIKHHRRMAKGDLATEKLGVKEPAALTAADTLREMADRARDELVPTIVLRIRRMLYRLEDAQAALTTTGKFSLSRFQKEFREDAQWTTDALEQLTQRVAPTSSKVVHVTFLFREQHHLGPWAEVASFLRDIAHSASWEIIKAADVPGVMQRGINAFRGVLAPEERTPFLRSPAAGGA